MKKLLVILTALFCFANTNAFANPGDSCSSAIALPTGAPCAQGTFGGSTTVWYSFQATSTTMTISAVRTSGAPNTVNSIAIYSACNTSPLIMDSTMLIGDSLAIVDTALLLGNTYYVEITESNLTTPGVGYNFCARAGGQTVYPCFEISYGNVQCFTPGASGACTQAELDANSPSCNTPICQGTTITFTMLYNQPASFYGLGIYDGTNWNTIAGGGPWTWTFSSTGAFSVGAVMTATPTQFINGYVFPPVIIVPIPTPTFTVSPNPVCPGDLVTITRTDSYPIGQSFAWENTNLFPDFIIPCTFNLGLCAYGTPSSFSFTACENLIPGTNAIELIASNGGCALTLNDHSLVSTGCVATSIVNVTMNNPSPTFTASPNPGCVGQSITFTNTSSCPNPLSPNYSWTWNFGDGSPLLNSPTASHTYAVAGTYTVGLTTQTSDQNCNCSRWLTPVTYTATITVVGPPTVSVTPNPISICHNSAIASLNISQFHGPNYSYTWSPSIGVIPSSGSGTGPASIITTFTSGGTYTVTVTDQCGTTMQTINVIDDRPQVTAIINFPSVCYDSYVMLSANATGGTQPYTYLWTPGNNTNASFQTQVTSSATYTVTVTGADGCSNTAQVSVNVNANCCAAGLEIGVNKPPIYNWSPNYNPGDFSNQPSLSVTGHMVINTSLTIINCPSIAMGTGSEIEVTNGTTLTIDNSRLWACNDMWQGIVVDAGGTLIVRKGSIIEDAIEGIEGQNNNINLAGSITVESNSILNNNYQSIVIDPYNIAAVYPLTIENSTIITKADPGFSNNAFLKAPHLGVITFQGIFLNNVRGGGIVIGNPASSFNTFQNMNYGVYGLNSDFTAYHNDFEDFYGPVALCSPPCPPTPLIGTAVVGYASNFVLGTPFTYYTALVGGPGSNQLNTFHECYRGVDITNYVHIDVNYNIFHNVNNSIAPKVGDHAIFVKLIYDNHMEIDYNMIHNYTTGIHLVRDPIKRVSNLLIPVNNDINNNSVSTVGNGFDNDGIIAEHTNNLNIEGPGTALNIQYNDVRRTQASCITIRNIQQNVVFVTNNNNLDMLNPISNSVPALPRSGILVDGCARFITVADNTIHSNGNSFLANTNLRGIYIRQSTDILVECNDMRDVGECLTFSGLCQDGAHLPGNNQNIFHKSYYGWVLENGGVIGQQGDATHLIDDIWQGPFTNLPNHYQTFTDHSSAPFSPIYVQIGGTTEPTPNGTTGAANFDDYQIIDNALHPVNCPLCVPPACPANFPTPVTALVQAQLHKFVKNAIPFQVFVPQEQTMSHQFAFAQISADTGLMTGDTVLRNFYNANQTTCTGGFCKVNQQMDAGNIAGANFTNNSLSPSCTLEQNQWQVNNIYLNTLALGSDSLTATQYNTLVSIASLCPLSGGLAVFQARTLINRFRNTDTIFENPCDINSNEARLLSTSNSGNGILNNDVKVYPNPTNSLLNIQMQLANNQTAVICLYNSLGEIVKCETIKTNLSTINTTDLAAGVYYYRVTDNSGSLLKADKQMIVH